jgi:hypothetical protein
MAKWVIYLQDGCSSDDETATAEEYPALVHGKKKDQLLIQNLSFFCSFWLRVQFSWKNYLIISG